MADAGVTWTDERVDLLRRLWSEGLSASQIAAELGGGVSRNAVISKAHRLGVAHGEAKVESSPRSRQPTRPPDMAPAVEPLPQNAPNPAPMIPSRPPAPEPAELPLREEGALPRLEGVTIMELRESMCRWPLGDPTTPEFRYCGAQAIMGLPYCPHHAQMAYQPAVERKRLRT